MDMNEDNQTPHKEDNLPNAWEDYYSQHTKLAGMLAALISAGIIMVPVALFTLVALIK